VTKPGGTVTSRIDEPKLVADDRGTMRTRLRLRLTSAAAALAITTTFAAPATAQGLKDSDRQRLLAHLEMTEAWLVSELQGLSKAQLTFQMTPDSWSVQDVVEHLAIAEPQYWQRVHDSMKQPATTDKIEATDAGILWYGIDRTNRAKTGEARVPKGKWTDVSGSLAEFRKLRAEMTAYAKTTKDDLRSRKLLEGNMDVYQWFLMISTHSQRHILQIREIKAHEKFPKR
jgi:phage pi2 protein 07